MTAAPTVVTKPTLSDLELTIVQAVAYVDVFDYPLTAAEIHRYLVGLAANADAVEAALASTRLVPRFLTQHGGFFALPGRSEIISRRRERERLAEALWPVACRYGQLMAALPFVRMVAVTGSLAANNVLADADIDYFIVSANDRLWLSRAFVIAIVRWAARRGIHLCPNYFLAEGALALTERNLYVAREIALMRPIAGHDVYRRLRAANGWTDALLPNATGSAVATNGSPEAPKLVRPAGWLIESALRTPAGAWLEGWEMRRKLARFQRAFGRLPEAAFSANWCKGHVDNHGARIMSAYEARLAAMDDEVAP